jgi:lambda family phage minor tail protein L
VTVEADVQTLEPGPEVCLFKLDASAIGGDIIYFHGESDQPIMWQGVEYSPWPIQAKGFARTSEQQPTPKLTVGNIDGSITMLCLAFDDLVGSILTRHRTFVKYLDGQPTADPTAEFPKEVWFVERKALETREAVEFELSSALDFNGVRLPRRQIIANQCNFAYRGPGCAYIGPPVADILDVPTSDPALDRCGKRLQSCKMRIWPQDVLNFGGFAAAALVRT